MTRHVKIIEGTVFDWDEAAKYSERVIDEGGEINWGAAMAADPGIMKCPECRTYYWREGVLVECSECGHQWKPND